MVSRVLQCLSIQKIFAHRLHREYGVLSMTSTNNKYESIEVYKNQIVSEETETSKLLKLIDIKKLKIFFVNDANGVFKGVISEGDIRRHLITNRKLPEIIKSLTNKQCIFCRDSDLESFNWKLGKNYFLQIPVLNCEHKIVGFLASRRFDKSFHSRDQVSVIAPTRISFAGGGSDLSYWFEKNPGCVINLGIAKYARVNIKPNFTKIINIISYNTNEKLSINIKDLSVYQEAKLNLVVQCLKVASVQDGFDLEILCDFNPGTGLGGSSSLVVALLMALSAFYGRKLQSREMIALAYQIERHHAAILGGWQDQIIAVNGGLCITHFQNGDYRCYKTDLSRENVDNLNAQLFLSPVGGFRESNSIHEKQEAQIGKVGYFEKMTSIVNLAEECADEIGQQNFDSIGEILHKSWLLKKSLGDFISNYEIDKRYDLLMSFGATGGKLLGAGQSGFLLMMVPIENQTNFLHRTSDCGIPIERISIDLSGVRIIKQ